MLGVMAGETKDRLAAGLAHALVPRRVPAPPSPRLRRGGPSQRGASARARLRIRRCSPPLRHRYAEPSLLPLLSGKGKGADSLSLPKKF